LRGFGGTRNDPSNSDPSVGEVTRPNAAEFRAATGKLGKSKKAGAGGVADAQGVRGSAPGWRIEPISGADANLQLGADTPLTYLSFMKSTALIGVILIVLGIAALAYQGITYTRRETVLNIGPVHAEADREHTIPLPPIIGVAAVVGGIVLLVAGARKTAL
jgi:hypothetical protein